MANQSLKVIFFFFFLAVGEMEGEEGSHLFLPCMCRARKAWASAEGPAAASCPRLGRVPLGAPAGGPRQRKAETLLVASVFHY